MIQYYDVAMEHTHRARVDEFGAQYEPRYRGWVKPCWLDRWTTPAWVEKPPVVDDYGTLRTH